MVLSDSRNQPRKLLPRLLDVFARFAEGRPDALLHLHTDPDDEFARSPTYSYDVLADVRQLGLERQVRFSPGFSMRAGGGLTLEALAAYYRAADVHLSASSGEGFGLPTLQAAAAGAVPLGRRLQREPRARRGARRADRGRGLERDGVRDPSCPDRRRRCGRATRAAVRGPRASQRAVPAVARVRAGLRLGARRLQLGRPARLARAAAAPACRARDRPRRAGARARRRLDHRQARRAAVRPARGRDHGRRAHPLLGRPPPGRAARLPRGERAGAEALRSRSA